MIDRLQIQAFVERALMEDIGFCDLTSELAIPAHASAEFAINARHPMVIAGIDIAATVFRRVRSLGILPDGVVVSDRQPASTERPATAWLFKTCRLPDLRKQLQAQTPDL